MKLSEIQATLAALEATPTKSLGQNFLHDQNLAEWTVDQLDLQPDEPWLEIGPGLGSLTDLALRRSTHGRLIEKDDRLIDYLRHRYPQLSLDHADAAQFDVRELLPGGPVKILGNLPYYVSSQILFNFTAPESPASRMIFTLQRELAERLAAAPGSKTFGAPTLLIGRTWQVKILRLLPPTVFLPAPKVESAVVSLQPRPAGELPPCEDARFSQMVKLGFSQRRKQLGNLLSPVLPDWKSAAATLDFPADVRAEALSLEQWCRLAAWPHTPDAAQAQDPLGERFDIVDEHDRVLYQASRREAHEKKLRHRAVHILLRNRKGELFLQKRSRWKDVAPGLWDSSAAGHVAAGDSYDLTAPREVEEELGVSTPLEQIALLPPTEGTGFEFVALFTGQHDGPFRLPPAEIETGAWFSPDLLDRWILARPHDFAPGFLECWKQWHSNKSRLLP
jgi:16S rRNA (adenine1518-N6/adenine1519-N6)-dimethyltransferase